MYFPANWTGATLAGSGLNATGAWQTAGVCGQAGVLFSGAGTQALETVPMSMAQGLAVSFDVSTGCTGTPTAAFAVYLQYSDTADGTWPAVPPLVPLPPCLPSASCMGAQTWSFVTPPGSFLASGFNATFPGYVLFDSSDYAAGWTHINVSVAAAAGVTRRFRWISVAAAGATNVSWGISNVVATALTSTCAGACSGRGVCQPGGACVCDAGYTGPSCGTPAAPRPTALSDGFEPAALNTSLWPIVGAGQRAVPGLLGSASLVFAANATRRAVTAPLNTLGAQYVQFMFLSVNNGSVVVAFSVNNGAAWTELVGVASPTASEYVVLLPPAAQSPATVFMWWQPSIKFATFGASDAWVSVVWCCLTRRRSTMCTSGQPPWRRFR